MFEIIGVVMKVLERIIPDPDKRIEAETLVTKAMLENKSAIYEAMKSVMAADAASEGWMTRNARPAVVFWSLAMMTWVVFSPIFGMQEPTIAALKAIPSDMWNVAMVGIGGYILAKTVTDTVKAAKK